MKNIDYQKGLNKHALNLWSDGPTMFVESGIKRNLTLDFKFRHKGEKIEVTYNLPVGKGVRVRLPKIDGQLPDSAIVTAIGPTHFVVELYVDIDIMVDLQPEFISTMIH